MKKLLVVVDMQIDFTSGALGTKEAIEILPNVKQKILHYQQHHDPIVFTKDTHEPDYLKTKEGEHLPIVHCIKGSTGWDFDPSIAPLTTSSLCFGKPSFGSVELATYIKDNQFDQIELIGLCTDICVLSNALLIKAFVPESTIIVDASCCAGVTKESHINALHAMKQCHITIINES